MLISRIFDGVTDLMMGVIVDRTKSKMGNAVRGFSDGNSVCNCRNALIQVPSGLGNMQRSYIFLLHITWYRLLSIQRSTYHIQP